MLMLQVKLQKWKNKYFVKSQLATILYKVNNYLPQKKNQIDLCTSNSISCVSLIDILKYGSLIRLFQHTLLHHMALIIRLIVRLKLWTKNIVQASCGHELIYTNTAAHAPIVKHPQLPTEDCSTFRWMGGTSIYAVYLLMLAYIIWQSSPLANTRRCDGHKCMG